jgi:hypothetical protein
LLLSYFQNQEGLMHATLAAPTAAFGHFFCTAGNNGSSGSEF